MLNSAQVVYLVPARRERRVAGVRGVERFSSSKLRAARERRGLSQKRLAELLGQARVNFVKYESGKRVPTARTLSRMAEILEVDIDDLLEPGPPDMASLRARRGLSQADVAEALGMSVVWYQRVETRRGRIDNDQLTRLAQLLQADPRLLRQLLLTRSSDQASG